MRLSTDRLYRCERDADGTMTAVPMDDVLAWGKWFEATMWNHERRVAEDTVGGWRISTVFLGMDHSHMMKGQPVLWETMVFPGQSPNEQHCERYTSYNDAVAGHDRIVKEWAQKTKE